MGLSIFPHSNKIKGVSLSGAIDYRQEKLREEGKMDTLWERLRTISKFEFTSSCRQIPPTFEQRKGLGTVDIRDPNTQTITFFEKGKWGSAELQGPMGFSNAIRWKKHPLDEKCILLEHLRLGAEKPVQLLSLHQVEPNLFRSFSPHECKEDIYTGSVLFDEHYIHLHWRIRGPKKDELITIVYY